MTLLKSHYKSCQFLWIFFVLLVSTTIVLFVNTYSLANDENLLNDDPYFKPSGNAVTHIKNKEELLNAINGDFILDNDIEISQSWAPRDASLDMNSFNIKYTPQQNEEGESVPQPAILLNGEAELYLFSTKTEFPAGQNHNSVIGGDDSGIKVQYGSSLSLSSVNVVENSSSTYGGGIFVSEFSSAYIYGTKISDNTSQLGGGGIYVGKQSILEMGGAEICFNQSYNKGAGIYMLASCFSIEESIIEQNELFPLPIDAGLNSTFVPCYGSGLCTEMCVPEDLYENSLSETVISKNSATNGNGAGIANLNLSYLYIDSVDLSGNYIEINDEANIDDDAKVGCGGGLYNSYVCEIGNTYNSETNFDFQIQGNTAKYGGGIYNESPLSLVPYLFIDSSDLSIIENHAEKGGGLFVSPIYDMYQPVRIYNALFGGNEAEVCGGGIYNLGKLNLGNPEEDITLDDSVVSFILNNANNYGAGIASGNFNEESLLPSNKLVLNNCYFENNSLGASGPNSISNDLSFKNGCQPVIGEYFYPKKPCFVNVVDNDGNIAVGRLTKDFSLSHPDAEDYDLFFVFIDKDKVKYDLSWGTTDEPTAKKPVEGGEIWALPSRWHEHSWEFSASDKFETLDSVGFVFRAKCVAEDPCYFSTDDTAKEARVSISKKLIYDGKTHEVEIENDFGRMIQATFDVEYYKMPGNDKKLDKVKDAGSYQARVTLKVPGSTPVSNDIEFDIAKNTKDIILKAEKEYDGTKDAEYDWDIHNVAGSPDVEGESISVQTPDIEYESPEPGNYRLNVQTPYSDQFSYEIRDSQGSLLDNDNYDIRFPWYYDQPDLDIPIIWEPVGKITPKTLDDSMIEWSGETVLYFDETWKKPNLDITVHLGSKILQEGVDYQVLNNRQKNPGEYTVIVKPLDTKHFAGNYEIPWYINLWIYPENLTIDCDTFFSYDGSVKTIVPKMTYRYNEGSRKIVLDLKENEHYVLEGTSSETLPGNYTANVKWIGSIGGDDTPIKWTIHLIIDDVNKINVPLAGYALWENHQLQEQNLESVTYEDIDLYKIGGCKVNDNTQIKPGTYTLSLDFEDFIEVSGGSVEKSWAILNEDLAKNLDIYLSETDVKKDSPKLDVDSSYVDFMKSVGITAEEVSQLIDNPEAFINYYLEIENIDKTIDYSQKSILDNFNTSINYEVKSYLDISLNKVTNFAREKVSYLLNDVDLKLDVPENIASDSKEFNKNLNITHLNNNNIVEVPAYSYDEQNNQMLFSTNNFSPFTIGLENEQENIVATNDNSSVVLLLITATMLISFFIFYKNVRGRKDEKII